MKKKLVCLAVSCLMALSLVLASCAPAATEEEEVLPEQLTILSSEHRWSTAMAIVAGKARNDFSHTLEFAEVIMRVYDEGENLVATLTDNTTDLGPGKTWNFANYYNGPGWEKVRSHEVEVGTIR